MDDREAWADERLRVGKATGNVKTANVVLKWLNANGVCYVLSVLVVFIGGGEMLVASLKNTALQSLCSVAIPTDRVLIIHRRR